MKKTLKKILVSAMCLGVIGIMGNGVNILR